MSYLLDTNVLSELLRRKPHEKVVNWFNGVSSELLHISVLTLGEIRKGIEMLEEGRRKNQLILWVESELTEWFQDRVLMIDQAVAEKWGFLQAQMKRPIPAVDGLIAATALHHDLWVVTRNEKDFHYPMLQVLNPWSI
jgi:predicted nucleic acid-binding protein